MQIVLGTLVPLALLALTQLVQLTRAGAARRSTRSPACLTLVGIFAMRWNVVIGGQLFSKSFLGYTTYKMEFATREGLLPAILLMILPFVILWALVRLLPPWHGREDRGAARGLSGRGARPLARGAREDDRWPIGWTSCESAVRDADARRAGASRRACGELEGRERDARPRRAPAAAERGRRRSPRSRCPRARLALVGRTLLVLAGAYLVRALTDAGTRARRRRGGARPRLRRLLAAAGRPGGARRRGARARRFHAMASSLIAFPLVWEATARFGLLGPRAACAALVGLFALGLAVAWRQRLAVERLAHDAA